MHSAFCTFSLFSSLAWGVCGLNLAVSLDICICCGVRWRNISKVAGYLWDSYRRCLTTSELESGALFGSSAVWTCAIRSSITSAFISGLLRLQTRLLTWVCATALLSWFIFTCRARRKNAFRNKNEIVERCPSLTPLSLLEHNSNGESC